ncbi:hypothetical protein EDC18_103391 [Natranaerovirga pectinivora]|uniref:Uncharacterized protein n=1 Tax=Natranaerovirga pectinivora TaxID=682400 RepID=A0A4V2V0F6_9FIRM|nr:hypothetical protein [Natranaerovirga pectinivora]TCT15680.1 hypothetical protein EDC18_103391 [Natranaerovirga pectinivora]
MANSLQTKIRLPLSKRVIDVLIAKFEEAHIEEDCVYIFSQGFVLHNFLITLSEELDEDIIAEHSSSIDRYCTLYVERYRKGISETIEVKS